MFKVNNENTRTMCKICWKLIMKKSERRQWLCSGIFIVNFDRFYTLFWCFHILHLVLVFPLFDSEQVNAGWEWSKCNYEILNKVISLFWAYRSLLCKCHLQVVVKIQYHWTFSIPPEHIRKPQVFWCFQGV